MSSVRRFLCRLACCVVLVCFGLPEGVSPAAEPAAGSSQESSEKAVELNRSVVKLYREAKYEEALAAAREAVEYTRNALGADSPAYADSLGNLAEIYKATGKYADAETPLKQAMEIRRKNPGEATPDFVSSLNNLAGLYLAMGRYGDSETLYKRALQIVRENAGEENTLFVSCLNNLASLYKSMGNYGAAEPLYARAGEILQKTGGADKPDYGIVLSNLAHLYYLAGKYPKAEEVYRRALDIAEKTVGEQHPQYVRTLNNLASLYEAMGDYAKAEPLYKKALEVFQATSGKTGSDTATALNNLAGLYKTIGDYEKAENCYKQANEIRLATLGDKHPLYASGLENLADLYFQKGDFTSAEDFFRKALDIEKAGLGDKHPDVALAMQNLAVLYKTTNRYAEAESLYRQALEVWKTVVGERHPDFALATQNLGSLCQAMGRFDEAEPLYRQALDIRTALLGDDHPSVAASLEALASLYAATSRAEEALKLMQRAQAINDRLIRNVFAIASEKQRLGFLSTLRGETDAYLSLIVQNLANSPSAVSAGMDLVLKRKAIVAEAMAAERDAVLGGRYPDLEAELREVKTLRAQIAQKMMSGPGAEGLEAHRRMLDEWRAREEKLELHLASRIPEINLDRRLHEADRKAVAGALPQGAALVEYVRFDWYDFKAVRSQGQPSWQPAHYLAFVLLPGEADNVRLFDLGPAAEIDKMISDFRSSITGEAEKPGARGLVKVSEDKPGIEATTDLYKKLIEPVLKGTGKIEKMILAPDGGLYRLPFGALPVSAGRSLIDEYQVSYVGAGRDVLRFGASSTSRPSPPVVTADPDYDLSIEGRADQGRDNNSAQGKVTRELAAGAPHFDRLPGTRSEGEHIAAMLGVKPMVERSASKGLLQDARSPRILHIATHGFFLPDQAPSGDSKDAQQGRESSATDTRASFLTRAMENPLLRSGLVLAGANSWLQGRRLPPEAGDGILTGEDASALDLLSTDLVVLSACETGLGDIKTGEGVFGLRRAFLLAGAKTLVMSLWKVPDAQTQMLMEEFYRRILAGQSRAEALRGAQLLVKASNPEPVYWGAFVCQGDPGPLPSPGQKN